MRDAMFFGPRRRRNSANRVPRPSDPPNDLGAGQPRPWQAWRRAAQRVTRTWYECLAADSRDQAGHYRRYLAALEEEGLAAAEIERMVNPDATAQAASHRVPAGDHSLPNR